MILIRTSGTGEIKNDKRLLALKAYLEVIEPSVTIQKLHDHKGHLSVYWENIPTKDDMKLLEKQWENFNELEEEVTHYYVSVCKIK